MKTAHDNEESDQRRPINFDFWFVPARTYLGTSKAHMKFICALLVPGTSYFDTFYRNRIAHSLQTFEGWLISRSCEQLSHLRPAWPSASCQQSTLSVVLHYKKSPSFVAKTCHLFFLFLLSQQRLRISKASSSPPSTWVLSIILREDRTRTHWSSRA